MLSPEPQAVWDTLWGVGPHAARSTHCMFVLPRFTLHTWSFPAWTFHAFDFVLPLAHNWVPFVNIIGKLQIHLKQALQPSVMRKVHFMGPSHITDLSGNQFHISLIYPLLGHSTRCTVEGRISLDWKSEGWFLACQNSIWLFSWNCWLLKSMRLCLNSQVTAPWFPVVNGNVGWWKHEPSSGVLCSLGPRNHPPPPSPCWGCNLQEHKPQLLRLVSTGGYGESGPWVCPGFCPWLPAAICFLIFSGASLPRTALCPPQPLSWASGSRPDWLWPRLYLLIVFPGSLQTCILRVGPPRSPWCPPTTVADG